MQVTKITENQPLPSHGVKKFTDEELQREYSYYLAQKLLTAMLEKGMISVDEFNKITALNRKSFSPLLAGIMPEMT